MLPQIIWSTMDYTHRGPNVLPQITVSDMKIAAGSVLTAVDAGYYGFNRCGISAYNCCCRLLWLQRSLLTTVDAGYYGFRDGYITEHSPVYFPKHSRQT